MFATPQSLQKRTGKTDVNRPNYLKQLVEEYKNELSTDEKREQVLANLANFAYDPINYEYFRRFDIIDLFLDNLKLLRQKNELAKNEKLLHFSLSAICNLCLDTKNKEHLIKNDIIKLISHYLLTTKLDALANNIESILVCLTLLVFMFDTNSCKIEILTNKNLINLIKNNFCQSTNKRLSNLASLFVIDCLDKDTSNLQSQNL